MVAIKDFGMPSCCVNCDMCLPCALDEGLCHITQHTIGNIYDKRPSDCPLVEIGTCKDCRWLNTDEDGNYYCRQTGCFDSLDFYCADFEKRVNKVGWSSLENVREKVERGSENG